MLDTVAGERRVEPVLRTLKKAQSSFDLFLLHGMHCSMSVSPLCIYLCIFCMQKLLMSCANCYHFFYPFLHLSILISFSKYSISFRHCFICAAPQIPMCRRMLELNPGLLQHRRWQSDTLNIGLFSISSTLG
jgi:hypothetical protein